VGYSGQIDDLARMPEIVRKRLPWLRPTRPVYAFGASMGGQESLLLLARHPSLSRAWRRSIPSRTWPSATGLPPAPLQPTMLQQWGASIGNGLRLKAREEIGGAPRSARRAYALRSPIAYVRKIAASGVPLQLWWSNARPRRQPARPVGAVRSRRCGGCIPRAPLHTVVGHWPHSAAMHPYSMLIPALKQFGLFPTRGTSGVHGRPLHRLLPVAPCRARRRRRLLPWYRPNANLGYDHVLRLGWNFLERRARGVYLRYAVFDGASLRGVYWQHNPAFLNAAFVDSVVALVPVLRRPRAIARAAMLDYQLAHGTTPPAGRGAASRSRRAARATAGTGAACGAAAPASTAAPSRTRSACSGTATSAFYELTGERRYLRCASTPPTRSRGRAAGDATHTPWPFRVDCAHRPGARPRGGSAAPVVGPIQLLDDLIELGAGDTAAYPPRTGTGRGRGSSSTSSRPTVGAGFYEDVPYNPAAATRRCRR
jgi:hypothetical protein